MKVLGGVNGCASFMARISSGVPYMFCKLSWNMRCVNLFCSDRAGRYTEVLSTRMATLSPRKLVT